MVYTCFQNKTGYFDGDQLQPHGRVAHATSIFRINNALEIVNIKHTVSEKIRPPRIRCVGDGEVIENSVELGKLLKLYK